MQETDVSIEFVLMLTTSVLRLKNDFKGLTQAEYDLLVHQIAKDRKKANLSEQHQVLCHFAEVGMVVIVLSQF